MTAVGKAGLLADIRQILVCEKQQIRRFVNAGKFNIFLAGLIVGFPEKLRKLRVTHTAHLRKLMYTKRLSAVLLNIFGNGID